jgi:hypothetical protein
MSVSSVSASYGAGSSTPPSCAPIDRVEPADSWHARLWCVLSACHRPGRAESLRQPRVRCVSGKDRARFCRFELLRSAYHAPCAWWAGIRANGRHLRSSSAERSSGRRPTEYCAIFTFGSPGEWRSWQRTCFGSLEALSGVVCGAVNLAHASEESPIIVWLALRIRRPTASWITFTVAREAVVSSTFGRGRDRQSRTLVRRGDYKSNLDRTCRFRSDRQRHRPADGAIRSRRPTLWLMRSRSS